MAAVASVAACAVVLVPYALTRSLYVSDDGDGMMILARWRPALEAAFPLIVLAPLVAIFGFLGPQLLPVSAVLSAFIPLLVVLLGAVIIASSGSPWERGRSAVRPQAGGDGMSARLPSGLARGFRPSCWPGV
ncbi:hypothetical protein [Isoptericola croceus]|uniref:hypothetical protein n=1 Tax=Isoptericola croceus TaxID=3031406 RepID=UPI0023F61FA0|nr:hypothetical protein [Isoptericola croceus]